MRAAQIKAELKVRNVDFSDCFDKESLVDRLLQARAAHKPAPAPPPPPPPASTRDSAPPATGVSSIEPHAMQAMYIKAELAERRIDFSDCFDKESLADKLVQARAGLISPMPLPPPPPPAPGAASGDYEFGRQSRQGEEDASMEDAFKAAGWTGGSSGDPSQVDTARSPGLNRNFRDIDQADFKKPYTRGGR